jgi:hypothetical protein
MIHCEEKLFPAQCVQYFEEIFRQAKVSPRETLTFCVAFPNFLITLKEKRFCETARPFPGSLEEEIP